MQTSSCRRDLPRLRRSGGPDLTSGGVHEAVAHSEGRREGRDANGERLPDRRVAQYSEFGYACLRYLPQSAGRPERAGGATGSYE